MKYRDWRRRSAPRLRAEIRASLIAQGILAPAVVQYEQHCRRTNTTLKILVDEATNEILHEWQEGGSTPLDPQQLPLI